MHDLVKFFRISLTGCQWQPLPKIILFEIRIQNSFPPITKIPIGIPIVTDIAHFNRLLILYALNNFTTVWTCKIFFFFTAVWADNISVQAREKLARILICLMIDLSVASSWEISLKFFAATSSTTKLAFVPGTVQLSYVI